MVENTAVVRCSKKESYHAKSDRKITTKLFVRRFGGAVCGNQQISLRRCAGIATLCARANGSERRRGARQFLADIVLAWLALSSPGEAARSQIAEKFAHSLSTSQ
jgi:aromatic ring hydroxylase